MEWIYTPKKEAPSDGTLIGGLQLSRSFLENGKEIPKLQLIAMVIILGFLICFLGYSVDLSLVHLPH